jgi:hypothetical protein
LLYQERGGICLMLKTVFAILFTGLTAGCAAANGRYGDDPSAAVPEREHPRPLAGHWQGTISETGGWYHQGSTPLDITIAPDRTWSGTVGKARASGTARFQGEDLVLSGTAHPPTGPEEPVYLRLTGDDTRRWGQTRRDFTGGDTHASVSLRRAG